MCERSSVTEHLWPCTWACVPSLCLPAFGNVPCLATVHGLVSQHRSSERSCLSSEPCCFPLPKRSLRPWKLLVSDAGVPLNGIIVGMGFGLHWGSGGNKTCQCKNDTAAWFKLACKKNGLYSELTLRIAVKIKSSLLKLKKKIILEVVNYSRKRKW